MTETTLSKTCSNCNQEKPLSQFYRRDSSTDGIDYMCRDCRHLINQKYSATKKGDAGYPSEQLVVDTLNSLGIFAQPGNVSPFNYIDVVAWGCVKIEVKTTAQLVKQAAIQWQLKIHQNHNHAGLANSDIIILHYNADGNDLFYVFPANHVIFYHENGNAKNAVVFIPNRVKFDRRAIPADLMTYHLERWDLIEEKRLAYADEIRHNPEVEHVTDKTRRVHTLQYTKRLFE